MARARMSPIPPRPESERREPIRPGPLSGRYAQTIGTGYGLSNASHAVGTVLVMQLAQHLPQRPHGGSAPPPMKSLRFYRDFTLCSP